jgi:hypothetical protein
VVELNVRSESHELSVRDDPQDSQLQKKVGWPAAGEVSRKRDQQGIKILTI